MIFKPGDKILYDRASSGSPNGVVKSVHINLDRKSYMYGTQICVIKCGQFKYTVPHCSLKTRIVEKISQIVVSEEFKKLSTRKLLGVWRQRKCTNVDYLYDVNAFFIKFDNNIENFFNDIGFDDYADKKLAENLMIQKYERDQHEIRYELSQRENVDHGLGAKIYRRKQAKKRHGKNKSKNR